MFIAGKRLNMEADSLIQNPKKQKLNEEQGIDGNRKCFGNLPELVLRHILSFLPIKDAVKTSAVSKRWEFLWTSNPNLNFGEPMPGKRTLLMNFVERVLYLRDSSDIKEFVLDFDVQSDACRVKSWITAAVRRNVQILNIRLWDLRGQFSLPRCVSTCETLTSFFIDMPCILKVPPIICFSNLKVLSIENVTFSDDYTTQQLLSGLPVLETLYFEKCRWGCRKVLSISAPKLRYLNIIEDDMQNPSDCQFMIFGATLKVFVYTGELFNEYCLYDSLSLESVDIDASCNIGEWPSRERARQVAYRMFKVLLAIPNVKDLRLYGNAYEALAYAAELLPKMPIFNNLWYLKLGSLDIECAALLKILQNSPCLETLKILQIDPISDREKADMILDPTPSCFLSHLTRIKVYSYDGKKDLYAVKILLKNAIALDEMIISFEESVEENLEMQDSLYKQLIKLPKGSQNCEIVLK